MTLGKSFAVVVLVAGLSFSTTAFARDCKPLLSSKGGWTNYLAAKSSARVHWRKAARRLYTKKYARWFSARKRKYVCETRGYSRRCYAIARPCS